MRTGVTGSIDRNNEEREEKRVCLGGEDAENIGEREDVREKLGEGAR